MLTIAVLLLIQAAPAASVPLKGKEVAERSADNRDKVICKRFAQIGSLVGTTRVCKTKADWDRERDNLRAASSANSCALAANGGSCN